MSDPKENEVHPVSEVLKVHPGSRVTLVWRDPQVYLEIPVKMESTESLEFQELREMQDLSVNVDQPERKEIEDLSAKREKKVSLEPVVQLVPQ